MIDCAPSLGAGATYLIRTRDADFGGLGRAGGLGDMSGEALGGRRLRL